MSGWPHQTVDYNGLAVAVAPTPTTLGAAIDVRLVSSFLAIVRNADVSQSLSVTVETSWDGISNWTPLANINATQLFDPVPPLSGSQPVSFDCQDLRWLRLRGVASGAGLTANVYAQRTIVLSQR